MRRILIGGFAAALLMPTAARAEERNPFTEPAGDPGHVLVRGHVGSHHRDGYGGAIGVAPIPWVQLEFSAAYRYETSYAGLVRVLPFPRSVLTPFVSLGLDRATTKLDGPLRYTTLSAFSTVGLQMRVAGRWFLGAEIAIMYELVGAAKVDSNKSTVTPSDPFDFIPGFYLGGYFL